MSANVAIFAGSSQGIGLHLTKRYLASTSLQVYALSRRPEEARRAILDGINQQGAEERLQTLRVDALEESSLAKAAEEIGARHGKDCLRLLFNVSGVLHAEKSIAQIDYEKALETFRINTLFPLMAFKHFFPLLPQKKVPELAETHGGLLPQDLSVVASMTARVGSIGDNERGGWYSYRASKAAQNQLTRTLSHEIRLRKKLAVAVGLHPGTVIRTALSTPFTANREADESQGAFEAPQSAEKLSHVIGSLQTEQSGIALDWAGKQIPW